MEIDNPTNINAYSYDDEITTNDPDINNAWSSKWADNEDNHAASYALPATANSAGATHDDEVVLGVTAGRGSIHNSRNSPDNDKEIDTFDVSEAPIQIMSNKRFNCRRCMQRIKRCDNCCPNSAATCPRDRPMIIAIIGIILAESFTILAAFLDTLDSCKVSNYTIEFGMFGYDGNAIEYRSYWEDCSEDKQHLGFDNASCAFEWRGLAWLLLLVVNWIIFILILCIILWKEIKCKCGNWTYKRIPYLLYLEIGILILAIMAWMADNSTVKMYIKVDGKTKKGKCVLKEDLGLSNWMLGIAMAFLLCTGVYGCCLGSKPFRPPGKR